MEMMGDDQPLVMTRHIRLLMLLRQRDNVSSISLVAAERSGTGV